MRVGCPLVNTLPYSKYQQRQCRSNSSFSSLASLDKLVLKMPWHHHSLATAPQLFRPPVITALYCTSTSLQPIKNKTTILKELDNALGKSTPPAMEYIYVNPAFSAFNWPWNSHLSMNPYGHSALRYTLPNGEQTVMNITGVPNMEMVHFIPPEEYLFGLPDVTAGSQQGGVYHRSFISIRVEDVPSEKVQEMHKFFSDLKLRSGTTSGAAGYSIIFGPFYNYLRKFSWFQKIFGKIAERGNCAHWTSAGLVVSGLLNKATSWPKLVWVKLLLTYGIFHPENINIIVYKNMDREKPKDGGIIAPFYYWSAGRIFNNLSKLADVVVKVDGESMVAVIKLKNNLRQWFQWLLPSSNDDDRKTK